MYLSFYFSFTSGTYLKFRGVATLFIPRYLLLIKVLVRIDHSLFVCFHLLELKMNFYPTCIPEIEDSSLRLLDS